MTFTVKIRDWEAPVAVEMGETILASALARGVPYPHGCRSGNCGACKSRLFAGEVEMAPYSEYALTEAEKEDGLILACRAVPWSDAEVSWLGEDDLALHPQRRMTCRVVRAEALTHDIKGFRLEIESGGPFTFSPGQYASVTFDGVPPRDFSMASRPDEPLLEFHVRYVAGGSASSHIAKHMKVGDRVTVEGPLGSSHLREAHRGPILAVAGGSGLAPMKSVVESALAMGMPQDIRLYFGARAERDIYLEDHFRALERRHPNFHFTVVLSEPDGPTDRRTGLVTDAIAADFADLDGFKAYIAGPPVMVEAATPRLTARGLRAEDIHADAFYTEAEKQRVAS